MNNDDAIEFLNYFCDENNSFDYAIMIDAPWGSGKTYFLRSYLNQRYPPGRPETEPESGCLWVSLFGKSNGAEVRDALFAEAHPMLSSKWAALGGSAVSSVIKKYIGLDLADKKLATAFLPDISAKLIVFDDLERSGMAPSDALGLINSFVESNLFKVIVIANQKPFTNDETYRRQKEKVIGRTLTVMSDPAVVLPELTKKLSNRTARDTVTANAADVLSIFRASTYHNLRSLRAALDDFDRLVAKTDRGLANSSSALRELLLYLIAVGMEVRADAVMGNDLAAFIGNATRLRFNAQSNQDADNARSLMAKYPSVNWGNPVVSPVILGDLIVAGLLPLAEINEGLAIHPLVVGVANVPSWITLWNWGRSSTSDYAAARADVLEQLARFKIVHPGEILQITGVLLALEEYDDHLLPAIEEYLIDYIDALSWAEALPPEISVFGRFNADGWAGYGFQKKDDPIFERIRDHLEAAVRLARRSEMAKKAVALMERLSGANGYIDLYECGPGKGGYGGVALLQNILVSDFCDILLVDNQIMQPLMSAFCKRYEIGYISQDLLNEKFWLIELEAEFRRRSNLAPAPFQKILANNANYWFGEIKNNIEIIQARAAL